MKDYSELKRLAEALIQHASDSYYLPCAIAYERAASPAAVLALIAELEQAKLIGRITCNFDGYKAVLDERDQIKAEVETLRKDADRFRFIEQDASSGMTHIYGDEWVSVIDSIINEDNHK